MRARAVEIDEGRILWGVLGRDTWSSDYPESKTIRKVVSGRVTFLNCVF